MRLKNTLLLVGLCLLLNTLWNCESINPLSEEGMTDYSCEGCHTTKALLSGVIEELNLDPPEEEGGAPG